MTWPRIRGIIKGRLEMARILSVDDALSYLRMCEAEDESFQRAVSMVEARNKQLHEDNMEYRREIEKDREMIMRVKYEPQLEAMKREIKELESRLVAVRSASYGKDERWDDYD